ncbi:hypothetical protein PR202_gb00363 [Eleusine coracana subsp. coracana]|uniref:Uncharacterized protein n=1 Tax=Eleusine coracana subsp. coracana TaxID=191504 RepID=A0AAV5DSZ4_ELECO|nr:hypothetical protein PR202_gb00363 [Eleusine coracana subsp. coracana]
MGSNEPLGTASDLTGLPTEDGAGHASVNGGGPDPSVNGTASGTGATSSSQGPRGVEEPANPSKRRRSLTEEEVTVFNGLTGAVHRVADAFETPVRVETNDVHPGLYTACMNTPGFAKEDLMAALTHLLDNRRQGTGFVAMTQNHRVLWLRQYLAKLRAQVASQSDSE